MEKYFLYLHGFQGSPNSIKANKLKEWLAQKYPQSVIDAPLLPMHTQDTLTMINEKLLKHQDKEIYLIGSSLGGYIANLLKQGRDDITKVILINPTVRMDIFAEKEQYAKFRDGALELHNMMPKLIAQQQDYLILLQEDDQTTPYEHAKIAYPYANIDVKTGQSHAYDHIEQSFELISHFIDSHCLTL